MFVRIGRMLVVLSVVFSIGLHWNVLQVVAWAGMLVKYAQDASFSEAVTKTFDGEHPCSMCKAIDKARTDAADDAATPVVRTDKPSDFHCVPVPGAALDPLPFSLLSARIDRVRIPPAAHAPPPTPPPIAA